MSASPAIRTSPTTLIEPGSTPTSAPQPAPAPAPPRGWIFDKRSDLAIFGAPVAVGVALVAGHALTGTLYGTANPITFLALLVGFDVAHVHATALRTYADPLVRERDRFALAIVPVACFFLAAAAFLWSAAAFWRLLAYAAVFHFARQPVGWMREAARAEGLNGRRRAFDMVLVATLTFMPLVHWHAHPSAQAGWFTSRDFVRGLPVWVADFAQLAHWGLLSAWLGSEAFHAIRARALPGARLLVVVSTFVAWHTGLVVFASHTATAFLVFLSHAVPSLFLCFRHAASRALPPRASGGTGAAAAADGNGDQRDEVPREVVPSLLAARTPKERLALFGFLVLTAALAQVFWNVGFAAFEDWRGSLRYAAAAGAALLVLPHFTHFVLDEILWLGRRDDTGAPDSGAWQGFAPRNAKGADSHCSDGTGRRAGGMGEAGAGGGSASVA